MARIVVFARADHHLFERGDIISVLEDGQPLGKRIDGNPAFRVVEKPGLRRDSLKYLERPQVDSETRELVKQRRYKIERDAITREDRIEDKETSLREQVSRL